ncbi:MAG: acyl-CoA dehydrogenase family protein [Candidatus Eremiobacteraeota bacterium]|nr:acyl-CoA dehydrogenase family protein [Candidatus Eremiobacteraeota bacterium]
MADRSFLQWPFFEEEHRHLASDLETWARDNLTNAEHDRDLDKRATAAMRSLGNAKWLRFCIPARYGGMHDPIDVRSICLARDTLARFDPLVEFVFAMQGLGSASLSLFGSHELCSRYLPDVGAGLSMAAFAVSEREAGSDVAAIQTRAILSGDCYIINGEKAWISNAGIADYYVVFARTSEEGARGLSALVVDADTPGLRVSERIETLAPHPLGVVQLRDCAVSRKQLLGAPGEGFKIAMATLDMFRATVGAAALGFARRAMDEALARVRVRRLFGKTLAEFQMTQAKLADMATAIDAAALLVYRAAWMKDTGAQRVTREASMAKMFATEAAQEVIDSALQLFGGEGVTRGSVLEALYREIRALRIYEGATEVQKLIIARQLLERTGA